MFFRTKKEDGSVAVAAAKSDSAAGSPVTGALEQLADAVVTPVAAMKGKKKGKQGQDDDLEYEWEFSTPFGKIEFELDPKDVHEEKERKRRDKADRAAAKKAEKMAKLVAKEAEKRGIAGPVVIVKRSNLLPALLIFAIVASLIGIAIWLFARPGEEDDLDAVPADLKNADALAGAEQAPSGFAGRIKKAVRAGKQASREAQREQEQRYHELSKQD
jgi:hypothetical protein